MTDQAKKYLVDILKAIALVDAFMDEIAGFEEYTQDLKTKSAVERQLGIIGEAVNQYRKLEIEHTFSSVKQIVNFRNRIIHAYDLVDDAIVWVILKGHIPILKEEARQALDLE